MKNVYKKLFEFRKLTGKVVKSSNNPFFKTKYADLNSVIEATDPALEEVGLVYLDRVNGEQLITELIDVDSGEVITSYTPLILSKNDICSLIFGSIPTLSIPIRRFLLRHKFLILISL